MPSTACLLARSHYLSCMPATCGYRECGLRTTRPRYPGNDPENGPARSYCPKGHSTCYRCGEWFHAAWDDHEADCCDDCEMLACTGCGEPTSQPDCALADRNGSSLCYVCEHDPVWCERLDVCRCESCVARRVELARQLRVGQVTLLGLRHGAHPEWMDLDDYEIKSHPLQSQRFGDYETEVGREYYHSVGAPGIGHRKWYALTRDGVGLLIEDTVREMESWEAR